MRASSGLGVGNQQLAGLQSQINTDSTMSAGISDEVIHAAKWLFFLIDLLQKRLDLSSKPDDRFLCSSRVSFNRRGPDKGLSGNTLPEAVWLPPAVSRSSASVFCILVTRRMNSTLAQTMNLFVASSIKARRTIRL